MNNLIYYIRKAMEKTKGDETENRQMEMKASVRTGLRHLHLGLDTFWLIWQAVAKIAFIITR